MNPPDEQKSFEHPRDDAGDMSHDGIWEAIRREVMEQTVQEPMLASFFHAVVLSHRSLEDALSFHLASKLASATLGELAMRDLILDAFCENSEIGVQCRRDLQAVFERDPACRGLFRGDPVL